MVKIEFVYWVIFSIIEAISVVYCYKKISRVNKVNIHFTLLCLGIVFLTDFTTIIHYSVRYIMFFIQPLFFYLYFVKVKKVKKHSSLFLALFLSLAVSGSETFFSVIISSVTGDKFVDRYWGLFYIFINIISLVFILKAIDYFKFNFKYFKKIDFKENIVQLNFYLLFIHLLLNVSHWLSNMKNLNSFSSMIATICFLMFMSILFGDTDAKSYI